MGAGCGGRCVSSQAPPLRRMPVCNSCMGGQWCTPASAANQSLPNAHAAVHVAVQQCYSACTWQQPFSHFYFRVYSLHIRNGGCDTGSDLTQCLAPPESASAAAPAAMMVGQAGRNSSSEKQSRAWPCTLSKATFCATVEPLPAMASLLPFAFRNETNSSL